MLEPYANYLPKRPRKRRGSGQLSEGYVADELAQLKAALATMDAMNTPVADLQDADVRRLLDAPDVGTATRRARFGALSRFLDWCVGKFITANPCKLLADRPALSEPRRHYLTLSQLARLWRAAESLREPVWRDLVRFLIAVPCRRGEATKMDWSHVDLTAAEWRQPGHLTKNRDPHRLHLHPLAVEILRERQKVTSGKGLVFPSPVAGGVVETFSGIKADVIAATKPNDGEEGAPLTGWTWHNFRRSFATALTEAGIPEPVADAVLNHRQSATRGGVLGVYQRAGRWPEQVRAMQLWGRLLQSALDGREAGADVLKMPAAHRLDHRARRLRGRARV